MPPFGGPHFGGSRVIVLPGTAPQIWARRTRAALNLKQDLVGWWALDEASGNRSDSHTNGLTLTDNNAVASTTGLVGTAARFATADSEYLERADEALLDMGAGVRMTLAGWIRLTTKQAEVGNLAAKRGGGTEEYYLRYMGTGGSDRFNFEVNSGAAGVSATSFGSPSANTWYFLVARYDGTNLSICVNDGTVDTTAFSSDITASTGAFRIGAAGGAGEHLEGDVDEVGLWKRALSAAEITYLYNGGAGRAYSDL